MKPVFEKMRKSLQQNLTGFGLNPNEWVINEHDSETITREKRGDETGVVKNIMIENTQDKNFRFMGEAIFEIKKNSFKADWIRVHLDPAV